MRRIQLELITVGLLAAAAACAADARIQAITDGTTYNAGSTVRLRLQPQAAAAFATLRYAGDSRPVIEKIPMSAAGQDYRDVWRIPEDARTGRYVIDLTLGDGTTLPRAATFAVHRKLARIERVDFDRRFYTSGDPVSCRVVVKNASGKRLDGLRVEFSEFYYPWIAAAADEEPVRPVALGGPISLEPAGERTLAADKVAVAPDVKQPVIESYAVVVWDRDRKNILDLFFTSSIFVRPAGVELPKAYPFLYLYPELKYVTKFAETSGYRHFYTSQFDSRDIVFDRTHTMFPSGGSGEIGFTLANTTGKSWRGVSIESHLIGPGGGQVAQSTVESGIDMEPGAAAAKRKAAVRFPAARSGVYQLEIAVKGGSGETFASNRIELAANRLPKSLLIFGAHQDDDMAHPASIRASVENGIPVHLVYFTSGDVGGCDRFYQHSCGPADAMDFGELRMEETRSALAYLGVPRDHVYFLGLPDGGSEQIWYHHADGANPYLSVLLASDHAPYEEAAVPNIPYTRRAAIDAAKQYIRKFQPEMILTSHPDERHVDHRVDNWIVVRAMQELLREGAISPGTTLAVDQVYGPGPQKRAPYRYEKQALSVSGETAARAQEAYWYYQSQDGNHFQGVLKPMNELPREEIHFRIVDWKDHEGWNEEK